MKTRCTVCSHPLITDIDLAILSGDYTLDDLSEKFGPSRYAFHRHKVHLEKKMRRSLERLENHRQQVSLLKLSAFLDHVEKRVEASAAADDTDRVYKGSHIGSRIIHQINKMDVTMEPDTAYRLLSSPALVSRDSLLPHGPQIIADLHQALVDQAFAPCPSLAADEVPEAADSRTADPPDLEKELQQLLSSLESKNQRRRTAKATRKNQHLLRKKLRQQKHLFQEKNLVQNFGADPDRESPAAALESSAPLETRTPELQTPIPVYSSSVATVGRESAAPPATLENFAPLETRNSELETPNAPADPNPQPKRHDSATTPQRQRRQLRKMMRHQELIFKAKNFVQNLTLGRQNATSAAAPETSPPAAAGLPESAAPPALTNPSSLIPFPCRSNPAIETPLLTTPKPEPKFAPEMCLLETPNRKPKTANRLFSKPKPPPPYDEIARRADELFEIAHGYKRHNPPEHIPNRRRDEDFRSGTIFGDVKNILRHM